MCVYVCAGVGVVMRGEQGVFQREEVGSVKA